MLGFVPNMREFFSFKKLAEKGWFFGKSASKVQVKSKNPYLCSGYKTDRHGKIQLCA